VIGSNDPDENPLTVPVILNVFNPVTVNTKTFLEGPYNGGSMGAYLRDNDLLPAAQPFNVAPWNYSGSESVGSIPGGVVDWVLLQLRETFSGSAVGARAGFITADGSIVDLDGASPVAVKVPPGNYYVVIRQRNHLDIMSASALSLDESSSLYDFTTPEGQAYGANSMKMLEAGVYGMFAGDGKPDGSITAVDRDSVWSPQNGTAWDYAKFGDFNLDGGIDATDLNMFFRPNEGSASGVPGALTGKAVGMPGERLVR
jgi:hypothetical protein